MYKGKCDVLDQGIYRGHKLIDHAMKLMEGVLDTFIHKLVNIDTMQFDFEPDQGTTDAIFILKQKQEKHCAGNKPLYIALVDLEKAFDRVPRNVLWWALRSLSVEGAVSII
jgi:hypothetical protein